VLSTLRARSRAFLTRSTLVRRVYARARREAAARRWFVRRQPFAELPTEDAVRVAYNVMLRRDPDPEGFANFVRRLDAGAMTPDQMIEEMRGSEEFIYDATFRSSLGHSIHVGRCMFVQSLPRAARILDLGGTHKQYEHGALVTMGYPYPFDEIVIVDLPDDMRHPIYRSGDAPRDLDTPRGTVRYRYHSMVDLSSYADGSFDLVYSGQSIEHVSEADAEHMLDEIRRVLRPGGFFALDTPNARATRLQQPEYIDPDHEIEYTFEELVEKLERAKFAIVEAQGVNYLGASLARGKFDLEDVIGHPGLFADATDCYILAFVCST
jgi:SAM-dependent methyltransferase